MENFFEWMSQPIPKEDVIILYGDFLKTLYQTIIDTYLGEDDLETRIIMSEEDKITHFEWCWNKVIKDFKKENFDFKQEGQHKDYFKSFFMDSFYNGTQKKLKIAIPEFIEDVFDTDKPFTKSDLDILTELYLMFEKNLQ